MKKILLSLLLLFSFFINAQGIFLTARHVAKAISGQTAGLCVKHNTTLQNRMAPIVNIEHAPANIDVAIGKIEFETHHWFELGAIKPVHWLNVATLGYPESALNVSPAGYYINLRAHKGYIQRVVSPNELTHLGKHKTLIELNFAVPRGLSGAPLFTENGAKKVLLGICIGSFSSELIDYEYIERFEDQSTHTERNLKVEQYGIAQDILEILDWKPNLLNGKSIKEIFSS